MKYNNYNNSSNNLVKIIYYCKGPVLQAGFCFWRQMTMNYY